MSDVIFWALKWFLIGRGVGDYLTKREPDYRAAIQSWLDRGKVYDSDPPGLVRFPPKSLKFSGPVILRRGNLRLEGAHLEATSREPMIRIPRGET